jgi:type IV fimbrial biogenesis protein FimT
MAQRMSRGFTLIELLIVVVVMGVLLAIGIPSFTDFIRTQRVKTASFELFASLVFARSEAITRNTAVTVSPSGGNWANGWSVTYVDAASVTQTSRTREALPSITITRKDADPTANIVYRGSGRLSNATAPKFELAPTSSTASKRCITIDTSGRPTTKADACS